MLKGNRNAEIIARIPPHNEEAEQAVLASLMIEAESYDRIGGILTGGDFYNHSNGIVFDTITRIKNSEKPYDFTSVTAALRSSGQLEAIGGIDYVAGLTRIIPNAANIEYYARQVKDKSRLRELIRTATVIQETSYDYDRDVTLDASEAVDEAAQMIMDLTKESTHKDPQPLYGLVDDMYKKLQERFYSHNSLVGLESGFYDLDDYINGLQEGALIVIAGRPGMGKTAFALNIAQNVSAAGKSVVIFSLEMTMEQLAQRLISSEAEVNSKNIQNGQLSSEDWDKLARVADKLTEMKIFMDDTTAISVSEIMAKCRRLKANKNHGLDLVIIDYLQLMDNKRIENREQQIADISRNLKKMAKDLSVPVIALSQLNRLVESRSDKRPLLSDLRESGAIEQDADVILFIYREEVYEAYKAFKDKKDKINKSDNNEQTDSRKVVEKGVAEILISKNRSGRTGMVQLAFVSDYTKFKNYFLDKEKKYT